MTEYDFLQEDESESEDKKNTFISDSDEADGDNALTMDDNPDCSGSTALYDVTDIQGKREVEIPELISMTKVLFSGYKGQMYLYLNKCLRSGELSRIVGSRVLNKTINREVCDFPDVSYWRIDRENFYADVKVSLKLTTLVGTLSWKGYLVCWCCFDPKLSVEFEYLSESFEHEGLDMLSRYLVPCATNRRIDEIAEELWRTYCPEALTDPRKRNAEHLAKEMKLKIMHCPVFEHQGVDGIVFFKEDALELGDDYNVKDEHGKVIRTVKAEEGKRTVIPADTIVINSNRIRREYSDINIFHECYHYAEHYLFYALQEMASNDRRQVPVKKILVGKDEEVKDELYFIENQAERGSIGLMMPATHTQHVIREEYEKVETYSNSGELYEKVGRAMVKRLSVPDFRVRQRMIQLGHIRAKGCMNRVNRSEIDPFAFDPDSWRSSEHTFIIDLVKLKVLRKENDDLRTLMESKKYIYADGHVVRNTPEYVYWDGKREEYLLTEKALAYVDRCCLRFVRKYVQRNVGRYIFGRLYYDDDYLKQNEFYLSDIINERQVDESEFWTIFYVLFLAR
ncbi:MAG: hypothetical protein IJ899_17225 [Blautia sp.]|nr:hypothetical protein [Blautia sp.]